LLFFYNPLSSLVSRPKPTISKKMKSSPERRFVWPLVVAIVLCVLALFARPVFAALTFSATGITGDSGVVIDSSSTITIGASSSTGITIGRSGITAMFPGTVTITGASTTVQNLVISGTCTGCGIGSFSAGGDLSGSSTSQTVVGLQGKPISTTTPSTNQVLTWNGSFWTPANVSSTGGTGIASINGLSNSTTSIVGAGTITVSTSSPNVITITGAGSGSITINSLATSTFQIQGTANEITVATSSPNIISLSLPQNIGTSSVPTFGGIVLNGNATTTNLTITGLGTSGSNCLTVNAAGTVATTTCSVGGGSSQFTTTSTGIYYTGGNVGIGTTTPQYELTNASTTYTNDLIVAAGPVIDVRAYGAKEDSVTDNTAAIQAAINATTKGATLLFPCTNGKAYVVDSPLSFASLTQVTIEGSNRDSGYCNLDYDGTAPAPTAFNFIGATYVTVENMSFLSSNSSDVPSAVLTLGRPSGCGSGGADIFDNVSVQGYAQSTLVYAVASESDVWDNPHFLKNGGGAPYIYYQSNSDTLGLNPPGLCASSESDLSHWFIDPILADYGPSASTPNSAIYIDGTEGGDDVFRDGYISEVASGSAFTINSAGYGDVTIDSIRSENAGTFLYVATSSNFSGLRLLRNTLGTSNPSGTNYMLNAGSNVYLNNADIESNTVYGGATNTSAFPFMESSRIAEDYPFTVTTSTNSSLSYLQSGLFSIEGDFDVNTTTAYSPLNVNGAVNASQYCINQSQCITAWPGQSTSSWSNNGSALYYNQGPVSVADSDVLANFNTSSTVNMESHDYLNATTTASFSTGATSIQISTTTGLAASGMVQIGNVEIAYYSSFTSAGTSSTLNGMARGLFGTGKQTAANLAVYADPLVMANSSSSTETFMEACSAPTSCGYAMNAVANPGLFVLNSLLYSYNKLFFANNPGVVEGETNLGFYTNNQATNPSLYLSSAGYNGFGTNSPSSTLHVVGTFQLAASSSIVTPSIGGAITGDGCDSATSSVDSSITSSTGAFITTPQGDPGAFGFDIYSFLSAPGVLTTRVCSAVTATPATTTYVVKLIK
jgi:hypothetical protein